MGRGGQSGDPQQTLSQDLKQCRNATELCELIKDHLDVLKQSDIALSFKQISFVGMAERSRSLDECANSLSDKAATTKDFRPEQIAEIFSSHAKLRRPLNERLLQNLTQQATRLAESFSASEISSTLSALSKLKVKPDSQLVDAFSKKAKASASDFSPQAVANTLAALSTFG
eukprot:2237810-Rhodomonas_salina.1